MDFSNLAINMGQLLSRLKEHRLQMSTEEGVHAKTGGLGDEQNIQ